MLISHDEHFESVTCMLYHFGSYRNKYAIPQESKAFKTNDLLLFQCFGCRVSMRKWTQRQASSQPWRSQLVLLIHFQGLHLATQ
jgi:hypothetical protein